MRDGDIVVEKEVRRDPVSKVGTASGAGWRREAVDDACTIHSRYDGSGWDGACPHASCLLCQPSLREGKRKDS